MKKLLYIMLVALLCVGCGNSETKAPNTEVNSENTEGTENIEDTFAYAKAYIDAIRAYENAHSNFTCKYGLIYVDNDEIPELVAGDGEAIVSLYTYANGKVQTLFEDWAFGVGGNAGYMYLERGNVVSNIVSKMAEDTTYYKYWKIAENGVLEEYYDGTLKSTAFEDKDGDGIPSADEILEEKKYFLGEKEMDAAEFESYIIKGDFSYVAGNLSANTLISDLEALFATDEEEAEGDGSANLSISEYQTICSNLMNLNSAYGSNYEKMAVHMAKIMADAEQISAGDAYRLIDIDVESRQLLALTLGYYEYNYEPVYGLHNIKEEDDYTYAAIYDKEEFKKIMAGFCAGGDMADVEAYLVDLGENVGIYPADGDSWAYIDAYDIKEDDDYVLIHAACYYGHNGGAENVYECTANMLFAKATDSIFGLRLVYVEGHNNDLTKNIASITASSQLTNQGSKSYGPNNLIDKKDETAWVEGKDGVGIGENIVIKLNGQTLVQEFGIRNGYQSSEDTFYKNGYVTRFSVDFGNGVVKEVVCDYPYFYYGEKSLYKVSLEKPVYTDTIIITILDAKAGSKYSDTCISEIEIY